MRPTNEEARAIFEAVELAQQERRERMPDEHAALRQLFDAYLRLQELGWQDAWGCPRDRTHARFIEAGSTGIHTGYAEEVSSRHVRFWLCGPGDLYPSRPILWKPMEREQEMA